jgi:hypothetical protein
VPATAEGLGGAALVGGVLQMVSESTLAVARTSQCADIGRMARALRGKVPGHLLGSVCGHMHARVGLGWDIWHGVWVGTGRVSWTDEDVGFFEGGGVNVTPDPIWMAYEWPMSAGARV